MRLSDGLPWSIPVTLASEVEAAEGDQLALHGPDGRLLGVLTVEEVFERDVEREAERVYRTTDDKHPGVAVLRAEGAQVHRRAGQGRRLFPTIPRRSSPTCCRPPSRVRRSPSEAGRRSSASRPATRSTGRTST